MRHFIYLFLLLSFSCVEDKKKTTNTKPKQRTNTKLEANLVVDSSYKVGDVRRYGLEIGKGDKTHPYTKKSTITSVLEMASETNTEIVFPKGFYNFSLIFKGIKKVNIKANEAEFSGPIYFIEDEEKNKTTDIKISGTIKTYYKVFMRNSQDIEIENLIIENDKDKNSSKLESMGCDIYVGVKYVYIKNLFIDGLGDSETHHGLTRAALQIHGWNNNPEEILIDHVEINSSRHGVYLTGENNTINFLKVSSFGKGKLDNIKDLEDSQKDETLKMSGLWVNRCNNCNLNKVIVNAGNSKGEYAVWLDGGSVAKQTIIERVELINSNKELSIFAEDDTNSVVRELIEN